MNTISDLKVGKVWLEGEYEIRKAVINYFFEIYKESNFDRSRLDGLVFFIFYNEDNISLTNVFFPKKLDSNITLYDGDKSPGPDGFSYSFLNSYGICLWKIF